MVLCNKEKIKDWQQYLQKFATTNMLAMDIHIAAIAVIHGVSIKIYTCFSFELPKYTGLGFQIIGDKKEKIQLELALNNKHYQYITKKNKNYISYLAALRTLYQLISHLQTI